MQPSRDHFVPLASTLARLLHPRRRSFSSIRTAHELLRSFARELEVDEERWADAVLLLFLERDEP